MSRSTKGHYLNNLMVPDSTFQGSMPPFKLVPKKIYNGFSIYENGGHLVMWSEVLE